MGCPDSTGDLSDRTERATRLRHTPSAHRVPIHDAGRRCRPVRLCSWPEGTRIRRLRDALLEVERWPEFAHRPAFRSWRRRRVAVAVRRFQLARAVRHAADVGADDGRRSSGPSLAQRAARRDRRQRGRLEALFRADASLVAYHLRSRRPRHSATRHSWQRGSVSRPEGPFGSVGPACEVDGLSIGELTARVEDVVDGRARLRRRPRPGSSAWPSRRVLQDTT